MAKSKQPTPPSTHQLRQYVAGKLTPRDQHEVEKEALQNQQVDDTLEGLQAMKKASVDESAALLDVRRRLQQRIAPKRRRLVPYYYASAAAVVMAVGLGWWLVQRQDLPESTAKTMAEKVLPSVPVPESTPILEENSPTLSAKPNTQTLAKKPVQEQVAVAPPTQEMLEAAPTEGSAASIVEEKKAEEVAAVSTQELSARPAQAKSRVASAPAAALPVDTFTLRGKILDAETREALAGSIIAVMGRNRGTSSANDGTFFLRGVRPNDNISIGAVGFTPVQITVKDSLLAPVLLQAEQNALSEVVVTGNGKRVQKPRSIQNQKTYSDYLRQSVQAFLEKNPQGPRGRVVVEFTVNELGELSDFENKNRANNQLFEEAVRILKQGEKWTPTYKNGQPQTARKRQVFQF